MDKIERSRRFLDQASKHFVALSWRVRGPGASENEAVLDVASCFVLDVDGSWFLVTAGHVIEEIKKNASRGCIFDRWCLEDQAAGKGFPAVRYAFDTNDWEVIHFDDQGIDYAVSPIRDLDRRALAAGGVEPITESIWAPVPVQEVTPWLLVGVPAESLHRERPNSARLTMIPIYPATPPSGQAAKPNYFYGKLQDRSPADGPGVQSIEGMSGGPIFGTREVDGEVQYWAIGVQSAWFAHSRIVCFCSLALLATGIQRTLEELRSPGSSVE